MFYVCAGNLLIRLGQLWGAAFIKEGFRQYSVPNRFQCHWEQWRQLRSVYHYHLRLSRANR